MFLDELKEENAETKKLEKRIKKIVFSINNLIDCGASNKM